VTQTSQPPNALSPAEAYLASLRAIVRQEMATWQPGCFDYVVVTGYPNGTADLRPADTTRGLPSISGLSIWSGLPGGTVQPQTGAHCSVVMLDTRQSKPVVIGAFDTTPAQLIQIQANLMQLFAPVIQAGDDGAAPLAHAAWVEAIVAALVPFAASLAAFGVGPPTPLTPLGAIGTALANALGAITPSPTTKLLGT
jgi:hypothetical protein